MMQLCQRVRMEFFTLHTEVHDVHTNDLIFFFFSLLLSTSRYMTYIQMISFFPFSFLTLYTEVHDVHTNDLLFPYSRNQGT